MIPVPDGFIALPTTGGYNEVNGPYYARRIGDDLCLGFRVEPRHTNPRGGCHGGMLMLLADVQLPLAARYQTDIDDAFLPTVNLTGDFLAAPNLGDWVQGRAEVVRVTRNLVFVQGVLSVDGNPVLRANGIFKRIGPAPDKLLGSLDLVAMFGARR